MDIEEEARQALKQLGTAEAIVEGLDKWIAGSIQCFSMNRMGEQPSSDPKLTLTYGVELVRQALHTAFPGKLSHEVESPLFWTYEGEGAWDAPSRWHDQGSPLMWRIGVCDDGTFDVSESDQELIGTDKIACFATLAEAKAWCVRGELRGM